MDQLCEMAYFGQNICDELWIVQRGSFEPVWKKYDKLEPMIVSQLKKLYVRSETICPGFRSFVREIFPNCELIIYEDALEFS